MANKQEIEEMKRMVSEIEEQLCLESAEIASVLHVLSDPIHSYKDTKNEAYLIRAYVRFMAIRQLSEEYLSEINNMARPEVRTFLRAIKGITIDTSMKKMFGGLK